MPFVFKEAVRRLVIKDVSDMKIDKQLLYIFFSAFLLLPRATFACSCGGDGIESNQEAYEYYDHIFIAKLVKGKLVKNKDGTFIISDRFAISPTNEHINIEYEVKEIFKGSPESITKTVGLVAGNSCGLPVYIGTDYLFYVKGTNAILSTCTRHKIVSALFSAEYMEKTRGEVKWLKEKSGGSQQLNR